MGAPISMREATAVVLLGRIAQHCTMTQQAAVDIDSHLTRVPPGKRPAYLKSLGALIECRLLGTEGNNLFVSQYGQVLLEFGDQSVPKRASPLTEEERQKALATIRRLLNQDGRLDPHHIDG